MNFRGHSGLDTISEHEPHFIKRITCLMMDFKVSHPALRL